MAFGNQQVVKRKSDLRWKYVDSEVLIISSNKKDIHQLNDVGSWIWQQLEEDSTIQQLVDRLNLYFFVSKEEAESDIKDFLGELRSAGLIYITS